MENLKEILKKHDFSFNKAFGQNFISDESLLKSIVAASGVTKGDVVLEIGCGAGTLTRELAAAAGRVVAYEIDRRLQPILRETLNGLDNVAVVFADVMKCNMRDIESELGSGYKVVANLPYYITTPLIMRFIEEAAYVKTISVMVQEEVADRLCALPGTPEYGAITAAIALTGKARIVKRVDKSMFTPIPKVDSAVVRIDVGGGIGVRDRKIYREVLRAAFGNRRKTLVNNLMQTFRLTRAEAVALVTECGANCDARGETLSSAQFAMLADRICEVKYDEIDRGKRQ